MPQCAVAQVVISEIMYDLSSGSDTGREWVEVFNAGASSVHFTDWKFFEANTNHALSAVQGGESVASGAYAIIVDDATKFLADHPGYTGQLFKSTFSLSNTGETLAIHMPPPDLTETDTISYQSAWGGNGDGKSLQRERTSDTVYAALAPTPGTGALSVSGSSTGDTQSASTTVNQTTSSATQTLSSISSYVPPPSPDIFVDAGDDRTTIVAADTEFDARAYDKNDHVLSNDHVRFLWNFGDGSSAEGPAVEHHFEYPGRYVVVVYIAENKSAASDRFVVTAEPANIVVVALPDGGIAIENGAGKEIDISYWIVRQSGHVFTMPEHSVILAGDAMRISQKILGFASNSSVELEYPNGTFAVRAGDTPLRHNENTVVRTAVPVSPVAPVAVVQKKKKPTRSAEENNATTYLSEGTFESDAATGEEESVRATSSNATSSNPYVASVGTVSGTAGWLAGSLSLALVGAGAASFVRARRKREWDIVEEKGD